MRQAMYSRSTDCTAHFELLRVAGPLSYDCWRSYKRKWGSYCDFRGLCLHPARYDAEALVLGFEIAPTCAKTLRSSEIFRFSHEKGCGEIFSDQVVSHWIVCQWSIFSGEAQQAGTA